MNNPKYKKRRRYFSSNLMAKKKKDLFLQVGFKGFISTCNGNEGQCIRESYNILNEYADKIYGVEQTEKQNTAEAESTKSNKDDDDVLDQFEKEIEEFKSKDNSAAGSGRRFQALDTGVPNCVFIKTKLEDPIDLLHTIVEDLAQTKKKKTRYLIRMVPVDVTCKAYLDDIKKAANPLFDKYFKAEPSTYAIVINRRHNSNLERDAVIKDLASMIQERNNEHKVNLSEPKFAVIVEVMKNICGLAIIRDYFKFSKYNLNNICDANDAKGEDVEGEASKNSEEVETVKEA